MNGGMQNPQTARCWQGTATTANTIDAEPAKSYVPFESVVNYLRRYLYTETTIAEMNLYLSLNRYSYTAISLHCGDVELHSKVEYCQKPNHIDHIEVDENRPCYVDCFAEAFAWDSDVDEYYKDGKELVIWFSIIWGVLFLLCCGYSGLIVSYSK